jgi:hypothetical protein
MATGLVLLVSVPASAQRDRLLVEPSPPAEWGVTFSLTPNWDVYPIALAPLVGAERGEAEGPDGRSLISGGDWSFGFARGRALGGDWGVSFVRQGIQRDSIIDRTFGPAGERGCFPNACAFGERVVFRNVSVIGPEVHLYVPFATFGERVQVGIMLAGGGGKFRGDAVVDRYEQDTTASPMPPNFAFPILRTHLEGEITDVANKIFYAEVDWTLTGRIQPGIAIILSPRVKVHAGAGFHYPGTTYFSLRATYFFPRAAP